MNLRLGLSRLVKAHVRINPLGKFGVFLGPPLEIAVIAAVGQVLRKGRSIPSPVGAPGKVGDPAAKHHGSQNNKKDPPGAVERLHCLRGILQRAEFGMFFLSGSALPRRERTQRVGAAWRGQPRWNWPP